MRMRDWSSDVGSSDLSRRGEALANVVGAEAWADGAFFDDVDRCRQRAGLQQQRQIMRFLAGQTGGLETLAEHATDAGDGNHVLDLAMLADRLALGVVVGDDLAFLEQIVRE